MSFTTRCTAKAVLKLSSISLFLWIGETALGAQVRVGIDHDMSKPTYGLQGASSSHLSYDDRNGLNMQGAINDILGPPVKIANGFNSMFEGANMAGIGSTLKNNGAVVGFDSRLLEAAGGASLMKGGLLTGGNGATSGASTVMKGLPGQRISSIIEMPVKVVALKDIIAGKALQTTGQAKSAQAQESSLRGEELVKKGDALKQQGLQQVLQGASEGVTNIGNMGQHIAGNTASAIRLLPIMMDLQHERYLQQHPVQQEAGKGETKQKLESTPHQMQRPVTSGGGFFGGLNSWIPETPFSQTSMGSMGGAAGSPLGGFFAGLTGGHNGNFGNNHFAAVLNASNPLTQLLMNPVMNPILMPITAGGGYGAPLRLSGSSGGGLFGMNSQLDHNGQTATYNYNLFPGIRYRETMTSQLPNFGAFSQHHQQQQPSQLTEKTQQIEQTPQQVVEQTPVAQAPIQQSMSNQVPLEQAPKNTPVQKSEAPKAR